MDIENDDIDHDVKYDIPVTPLGYLLEALSRRHRAGKEPFLILPLENLKNNGEVICDGLITLAQQRNDADLINYIEEYRGHFFNTMVDKICPNLWVGGLEEIDQQMQALLGMDEEDSIDQMLVLAESFGKMVIEQSDPQSVKKLKSVFPFEKLQEQYGDRTISIVPAKEFENFELAKLRMVNGGHRLVGILGALKGEEFVHRTLQDDVVTQFMDRFLTQMSQTIAPSPTIQDTYNPHQVMQRFQNQAVKDQCTRLVRNSSTKLYTRLIEPIIELRGAKYSSGHNEWTRDASSEILPGLIQPIAELKKQNRSSSHLEETLAFWLVMLRGKNEKGNTIVIEDKRALNFGLPELARNMHRDWEEKIQQNPQAVCDISELLESRPIAELLRYLKSDQAFLDNLACNITSIFQAEKIAKEEGKGESWMNEVLEDFIDREVPCENIDLGRQRAFAQQPECESQKTSPFSSHNQQADNVDRASKRDKKPYLVPSN